MPSCSVLKSADQSMKRVSIVGCFDTKSVKNWGAKPGPKLINQEIREFWLSLFTGADACMPCKKECYLKIGAFAKHVSSLHIFSDNWDKGFKLGLSCGGTNTLA